MRGSSTAAVAFALASAVSTAWACGKSAEPVDVVQAQVEAYNAHDIDSFAACYADDVTITDLTGKRPVVKGIPALKTAFAFLAKVPKDFHVEIVERAATGAIVVDHERVIGLPPEKGRPESMAVYEVRGGKIVNLWFPPAK